MSKRDPRLDPRPGDVLLRCGDLRAFTVECADENGIVGHFQLGLRGSLCGLRYWRETWAKGATVVERGEE